MAAATPSVAQSALPTYDITARKAHQWAMVALVAIGFVIGDRAGAAPVALAGVVMLVGRFWWPADVVRQAVWRWLEPAGVLPRREAHEDRVTRRLARAIGGGAWIVSAVLLVLGAAAVGWVLALAITVMVVLDASVDFCALCFLVAQLDRRGLLPASVPRGAQTPCLGER